MPQLAIAAAGAMLGGAVGGTFLGIGAASWGWMAGSMLGSALFAPKNKAALADLRSPKITMGQKMHRVYGTVRVPLSVKWQSEWRATENEAGGKGGGGSEFYTYSCDVLYWISDIAGLPENLRVSGVRRLWWNGELVWSRHPDSDAETLDESENTDKWAAMTFFDGDEEQLPWSVYEAALGATSADAHRRIACVAFENIQTGTWSNLPLLEAEVYTVGTEDSTETLDWLEFKFHSEVDPGASAAAVNRAIEPAWQHVDAFDGSKQAAMNAAADMMLLENCAEWEITSYPDATDTPAATSDGQLHFFGLDRVEIEGHWCGVPEHTLTGAWEMVARAGIVSSTTTVEVEAVDLADIVSAECLRSGLTADDIDVTELVGIDVRGFMAQGSAREAIEDLMGIFHFYAVCSDKLYFKLLDATSVATIPFTDSGVGVDQPAEPFTGLERGSDIEVPSEITVVSPNISADYDPGAETSDRLVTAGRRKEQVQSLVVMTPAERKGRAITFALDARTAMHTARMTFDDTYAKIEPGDVITPTDEDGNTYVCRISRESYAQGVHDCEIRLFDRSVLTETGTTSDTYTPAVTIAIPGDTNLYLLDMPILRDADDSYGHYIAIALTGASAGSAYRSVDGVSYTSVATATQSVRAGTTDTALGDWSGGNVFDTDNVLRATFNGELSSATRDAVLDAGANAFAIVKADDSVEIIQARTVTLVSSAGGEYTYDMSDLLRGRRGTEHATTGHASGESIVRLDAALLSRHADQTSDTGALRYFKGVTAGRQVSSSYAIEFTNTQVGLKPFAPVNLRADRDDPDAIVLTWDRRTRMSGEFLDGQDVPLGEDSESYDVLVYDDTDALISTTTVSAASHSIDITSDDHAGYTATVYQRSAAIGRGYPVSITL
jgi:hypothetical protein